MAFTPAMLELLVENRLHNSQGWYNENKPRFAQLVHAPLVEFVTKLTPYMLKIDPLFVTTPKTGATISRVFRDTRFSKDKTLYRDRMWVSFRRNRREYEHPPSFFFEIAPDGIHYGCGYYETPPKVMQKIREMALQNHPAFNAAFEAMNSQTHFTLHGDTFKRPRYPDAPQLLQPWLNLKSIYFFHSDKDATLAFSDNLPDVVGERFLALKPMYNLLWTAHDLSQIS